MPVILLERLPLPSLKTYTILSVGLLASALYYAHLSLENDDGASIAVFELLDMYNISFVTESVIEKACLMAYVLAREPWCLVTLINTAYCCLILFGKLIQQIVFGHLRVVEQQHVKDKFWNFVFYKFIFIFGVMNAQEMEEIVLWCTWFSILGFLHILAQLCKDRFEYLSFSPATPLLTHSKVLLLLFGVHWTCLCLLAVCIAVGYFYTGVNTFAFMAAEALLLVIKTLYVIVRYGIHLWDVNHDGVWENRAIYVYYSELLFEISALSVDLCHHLHMLLWGNIFLSMASLVICMQLRFLFHELQRRIRRHQNYRRVVSSMEARFSMATTEELQRHSDDCAICWEKMESARKLPCGHIFHNSCLRSWLEQDTSCPTCRTSLSDLHSVQRATHDDLQPVPAQQPVPNPRRHRARRTNRFHFDASRYVSWLPSFSVEVTHMLGYAARQQQAQTSQFDNMVRQVSEVFPSIPPSIILDDLRITNSVEMTIDNIVEGRLTITPDFVADSSRNDVDSDVSQDGDENDRDDDDDSSISPLYGSDSVSLSDEPVSPGMSAGDGGDISVSTDSTFEPSSSAADDDITDEHSTSESLSGRGYRFSKSPSEREAMLARRKEAVMDHARKRFLSQSTLSHQTGAVDRRDVTPADGDMSDAARQCRQLVYNAAQRRLQSS